MNDTDELIYDLETSNEIVQNRGMEFYDYEESLNDTMKLLARDFFEELQASKYELLKYRALTLLGHKDYVHLTDAQVTEIEELCRQWRQDDERSLCDFDREVIKIMEKLNDR